MSSFTFKKLSNLVFFHLFGWSSSSNEDVSSFSLKRLKYLEWVGFPLKCINIIDMANVVVIKLHHSKLKILWEGFKSLKKLRILDVSFSCSLTKTGDFAGLEKLEQLRFTKCEKLEELHSSIGCLGKLVYLDLHYCRKLKRFPWEKIDGNSFRSLPDSLCQLHELEEIRLSDCTNLKSIPNLHPNSIRYIEAVNCISLVNLPSNMSALQFLEKLCLDDCFKLEPEGFMKVTGLRSLRELSMRNCNVSQVSGELWNLVSLENLNFSSNTFSSLPDSFSNLAKLKYLDIYDCSLLELLPLLPSNLKSIDASWCPLLNIFPCKLFQESFFIGPLVICLQRRKVPKWCSYENMENDLSFEAPMHLNNKICGVIVFAIRDFAHPVCLTPTMLNKTKETRHSFDSEDFDECSMYVMMYPLNDTTLVVEPGDTVLFQFQFDKRSDNKEKVMNFGLRLIYEGDVVPSSTTLQFDDDD